MSNISDISNMSVDAEPKVKKQKIENGCNGKTKLETSEKLKASDEEYFSSYSDIELHRTMIEDSVRTNTYKEAIMDNKEFIAGKVVADVGCGTGILSIFCAQAGAKKVYAIDASNIANHAKEIIKTNGFEDVITVFKGKAEEIELPEKVDVVVSEWMGYMLLYETMLPSVLHVRDKWLKSGGKMFPERATLKMCLSEIGWITKYMEGTYDFWISLAHVYDIDMYRLADHAVKNYRELVHVHIAHQDALSSDSIIVCDLDLNTIKASDLESIESPFKMLSMGSRTVNSLTLWFDVIFPLGRVLSTSPHEEETHWQNTVLIIPDARVKQDMPVEGKICIRQHPKNHRYLQIQLDYTIDDKEDNKFSVMYNMDDNCVES